MSFISRITSKFSSSTPKVKRNVRAQILPNRFKPQDGSICLPMGAVTRTPRQNTTDELIRSIEAYADIYETGVKSAEPKLIELAKEYGVDLPKEAKKLGVDIFEAAKRKGKVEHDFKVRDWFTGEEKIERRTLDLTEVTKDAENQMAMGETNSREIRNFLAQAEGMSEEHLGVAHDIIDLGHMGCRLHTNINLQRMLKDGKTTMSDILAKFPEVSRRNPGAIELLGKVFNHSDDINSKYFLCNLFGNDLANTGYLTEQLRAIRELVPAIAKETLSGGYLMDYSKENKFFRIIADFCRVDAKPENIKLLPRIFDMIDSIAKRTNPSMDCVDIALGDAKVVKSNMEVLPQVLENAERAEIGLDVSSFLTKNVNLD